MDLRTADGFSLVLLRRAGPEGDVTVVPTDIPGLGDGGGRIRCPRCAWEPRKDDRWLCVCGHVWNTFDTGGVCPACALAWQHTACHRCHEWSPHEDWYSREGGRRPS